jgi:tetratricopeptide (TPR) repeat protein
LAKREAKYDYKVTKKLKDLRLEAKIKLVDAAKYFDYKRGDTIREWETGISRCPKTKRHKFITYLLNVLGLGKDEKGIIEFLKLWEELVFMTWELDQLTLEELEFYVPEKIDIISKLFDALGQRVPLQLLEPVRHFTGRDTELKLILEALQPNTIVSLLGPGGIGKTALAAEAIQKLVPDNIPPKRFPDGIISWNFYEDPIAHNALIHIVRSFNEEIDSESSPAAAARRALSGKKVLLVLEGGENANDLEAVLAERNQCGVLITTRKREHIALVEKQIELKPLETDEGIKLLSKWVKAQFTNEEDAERIYELVGGLPLAIRLAGSYMAWRKEDTAQYLDWLEETPLEALDHGDRRLQSIPILLDKSIAQLTEIAQQILEIVGSLAPAPFDQRVLTEALTTTSTKLRRAQDELVNYSLLDPVNERYKISHTLVHTYARNRMLAPVEIIKRLATYYTELTNELHDQGTAGFIRLDLERTHILAILDRCAEQENWGPVRILSWALDDYLDLTGHWTDRMTTLTAHLVAARALGDRIDEGDTLRTLGTTLHNLGQIEPAIDHHQQALTITRAISDQKGEAAALNGLGIAHSNLGNMEEAIELFEQALSIARKVGDRQGEGLYLNNIGQAYSDIGQLEEAIANYKQALSIAREAGDRGAEGNNLNSLGIAYSDSGNTKQAIEYYEQALVISREIGDRNDESNCLGNLGLAYSELGQVKQAVKYYEQGLTIARDIGDRRSEGNHLGNLGLAYCALGQTKKGIVYYEQALDIAREIGNRHGEVADLGNLGNAHHDLGQMEQAIECYIQALTIAREIGDRQREGINLGNIGNCYSEVGLIEEAIDYYEQALNISREIGDRRSEAADLGNLGTAFSDLGYPETAFEYYEQGLTLAQETGDRHFETLCLGNVANEYCDLGQLDQAIEHRQQALKIAREIGDRRNEADHLANLGDLYRTLGQVEQAKQYLQQSLIIFEEIKSPKADQNRRWLKELEEEE